MPDPLHIEPHPESERSYHELREEYRADNLARLRLLLVDYRVNGAKMKMLGRPLALDGATTPALRAKALLAALDESVTQDFGLEDVPKELVDDLIKWGDECGMFEKVTWADGTEGVFDHDAPPVPIPVEMMTEQEQLDYVDRAIEESKRNG